MKISANTSNFDVEQNYLKDQIEGHQFVAKELQKEINETHPHSAQYATLVKQLTDCQSDIAVYTERLKDTFRTIEGPVVIETKKAVYRYDNLRDNFIKIDKPKGTSVFCGSGPREYRINPDA
ncbi:MAG TPA: hypothetical protein VHL30_03695 [Chlamydiales bacterium]|jgi:hypothetical protein|nr:hypothetical protein [Chlamydiales bacterium]